MFPYVQYYQQQNLMPRILPIAGGLILDNTNKEASSQDKFSGVRLEVRS